MPTSETNKPRPDWWAFLTAEERVVVERADAAKAMWKRLNGERAAITNRAIQRAKEHAKRQAKQQHVNTDYPYIAQRYGLTFKVGQRVFNTVTGTTGIVEPMASHEHYVCVRRDDFDVVRYWHPEETEITRCGVPADV